MDINLKEINDHLVFEVVGDINHYNLLEFKKNLFTIADSGQYPSVIVDMKDVEFIDSSGIGTLVSAHKKMKANNGQFALLNVHEDLLNLLKLGTLDKFFKIYKNESELE
ncbi:MAG: STAS domain-containing protein [bacterium]|nr:STAS domain-containing protein [bacterium]